VRRPLLSLLIGAAFVLLSGSHPLVERSFANANDEAIDDQVAVVLIEEPAQGKIRVVIPDFIVSPANNEKKLPENEMKDLGTRFTEEFIANIISKIKDAGKRDKISIIDRSKLDEILREKKFPTTDITEHNATEIGGAAGLDVIVIGSLRVADKSFIATAKVVRVKDGEILSIAKENRQEKPAAPAPPVTILDTVEKIKLASYKALPLNLTSGGILNVTVNVVHGNPLDIYVLSSSELDNFKNGKTFKNIADFPAAEMKNYKRSAHLGPGDYYLVLRDKSVGIFSARSTEIQITVQLEP